MGKHSKPEETHCPACGWPLPCTNPYCSTSRSKLQFHKASYSYDVGACVEVADAPGVSAVRDTENRELGFLMFPSKEWNALLEAVR